MGTPRESFEVEVLWVDDATGEIIRRERRTPQVGPELFGHDPGCSSFIVHFPEGVAEPCDCGKDDPATASPRTPSSPRPSSGSPSP